MSVRIGHASIDERGKAYGGQAGDQTGKEVCVRSWYSKPWTLMLRYYDSNVADKAAGICETLCGNANIGYDQYARNTLHDILLRNSYDISKVNTPCETDCSAFVTVCYIAAGVDALEYTINAPTTATMQAVFRKAGFQVFTADRYLQSGEYLRRGDILVTPGSHTVMALDNGALCGISTSVKPEVIDTMTEQRVKELIEQYGADAVRAALADMGKAQESDWAKDAMTWAAACGITDGSKPGSFCTREQVITMMYRFMQAMRV